MTPRQISSNWTTFSILCRLLLEGRLSFEYASCQHGRQMQGMDDGVEQNLWNESSQAPSSYLLYIGDMMGLLIFGLDKKTDSMSPSRGVSF